VASLTIKTTKKDRFECPVDETDIGKISQQNRKSRKLPTLSASVECSKIKAQESTLIKMDMRCAIK
jgi:hypothetical protein